MDGVNEKAPRGAGLGGFIEREISRINEALIAEPDGAAYDRLYAAQQALSWALEPNGFRAPYDMIMGTQGG